MNGRKLATLFKQKTWCLRGAAAFNIDLGSGASIDNLADNAFTLDGWFRVPLTGASQYFCSKGTLGTNGFIFTIGTTGRISLNIDCATTDASSLTTGRFDNNTWMYVMTTFDDAGDRKPYIYVNAVLVAQSQTAGIDAVVADAAAKGYVGRNGFGNVGGAYGWMRWSNIARSPVFIPRQKPPVVDANTVGLWKFNAGAGTVLTDYSGNANTGAISSGTWAKE